MTAGQRKLDRAVGLMRDRGLGGLVVYSDGTCNILRASYLRYFAEFAPMGPHNAVVISPGGEATLLVTPQWDVRRARRHTWIDDVSGGDDFSTCLAAALRRLRIGGRVGLAGGREMPYPVYAELARAVTIVGADDVIEAIAREKSPDEHGRVRRAAAAADAGFEAFRAASRIGVREYRDRRRRRIRDARGGRR